jgi:ABC-2 type transport system permease protein
MNLFNPRRFVAMLIKESLQILRDPASLLIAFALPRFCCSCSATP